MIATATNFERKGVAPRKPERPALKPGSRSIAITTGIIGQAKYAPTRTTAPSVNRHPTCSALYSGSVAAMTVSFAGVFSGLTKLSGKASEESAPD